MLELSSYRQEIDDIDREIIELIGKRFVAVRKVGVLKKENNMPPLQPGRWAEVIKTRTALGVENGLSPELVKNVWNEFHKYALEVETKA